MSELLIDSLASPFTSHYLSCLPSTSDITSACQKLPHAWTERQSYYSRGASGHAATKSCIQFHTQDSTAKRNRRTSLPPKHSVHNTELSKAEAHFGSVQHLSTGPRVLHNSPKPRDRSHSKSARLDSGMPSKGSRSSPDPKKSQSNPRLTLTQHPEKKVEGDDEEDEELSASSSDGEEEEPAESTAKTAAERLAEKRRMKRFRLTHSQTRYLMNEFSRQPNPDAAHREKLSRDIPGLSPRQVQVWFQNRRAKMKRLTGDDQERIIRSRALPAGFDFSHNLQPAMLEQQNLSPDIQRIGSVDAGPFSTVAHAQTPVQQYEHRPVPPINMALVYRNPPFGMGGAGGSTNPSPVSSVNEGTAFSGNQSPIFVNSRNPSPFQMSGSFQRHYPASNQNVMAPTQGPVPRGRASSLANISPTPSLQTYPPAGLGSGQSSFEGLRESFQMLETQNESSMPINHPFDSQYDSFGQFQMTAMPAAALPLPQDQLDSRNEARRHSASMGLQANAALEYGSQAFGTWPMQPLTEDSQHPGYQVQGEQRGPRGSRTGFQSQQGRMMQPSVQPQSLFRPAFLQDQASQYGYGGQVASSAYPTEARRPSYQGTAPSPDLPEEGPASRTQSTSQSPGYPPYYSPPQQ